MKPKGMFSCSHGKVLDLSVMLQMISPFVAGSNNLTASTLYQNLSLVMKMDAQWFIDLVNSDLVYLPRFSAICQSGDRNGQIIS